MDWKKATFPIIIAAIMILSTFGVIIGSISDDTQQITYNNKIYRATTQGWTTNLGGTPISFTYQPTELANATNISTITIQQLNQAEKIYLSITPEEDYQTLAYYFQTTIKPYIQPTIIPACTHDNETCANLPLKTCNDAAANIIIVEIHNTTTNTITYQNNCLTFNINPAQADYYTEALLFKALQL